MMTNILDEQKEYYRNRAAEYDDWFYRQGRFFIGEDHKERWFSEVDIVDQALADSGPGGKILEIASGTGIWTEKLLPFATSLTAIDASMETITICKQKLPDAAIEFIHDDIFRWKPTTQYDFVFFGHWLSHVPKDLFDDFWRLIQSALAPGGKAFFLDSLYSNHANKFGNKPINRSGIVERKLNNGEWYRIVKEFYEPDTLMAQLAEMGWTGYARGSGTFFVYGCVSRADL